MTCNCVRDNESRLGDHYSEQLGVHATAEAKNMAIVFGAAVSEKPYMPYAIRADKPGFKSAKGKEIHMFFSFCPFCGVSLKETAKELG